ncbi:MAG: tol-pal system protein YbgF [bacterium]
MKGKKFTLCTIGCTFALFSMGCLASTQEMIRIKSDVRQMQQQLDDVTKSYVKSSKATQENQANFKAELEEMKSSLQVLREQANEESHGTSRVSQRLDDIEIRILQVEQRLSSKPSIASPAEDNVPKQILRPTDLYQVAYSDYASENYDLSIVGFREYLKKYPQTEFSASAQYWIGECYYSKGEFENSLREFDKVISFYPRSDKVSSSQLKKAFAFSELGRHDEAKRLLEQIIKEYPASDKEVKLAQEKLDMINNAGKTAE